MYSSSQHSAFLEILVHSYWIDWQGFLESMSHEYTFLRFVAAVLRHSPACSLTYGLKNSLFSSPLYRRDFLPRKEGKEHGYQVGDKYYPRLETQDIRNPSYFFSTWHYSHQKQHQDATTFSGRPSFRGHGLLESKEGTLINGRPCSSCHYCARMLLIACRGVTSTWIIIIILWWHSIVFQTFYFSLSRAWEKIYLFLRQSSSSHF